MFRFLIAKAQTPAGALSVVLTICLISAGAFLLISSTGSQEDNQEQVPFEGIRVERASIATEIMRHVEILRKESLKESLSKLSFPEMYFWPGTFVEGEQWHPIRFPFVPAIGQYDVDTILSNRRFLKVHQDLSVLPKDQANQLLREHIIDGTKRHRKELDGYINAYLELGVAYAKKGIPLVIPRVLTDTGEPTMHGMRLKVFSLVLIAGNLKFKQAFREITDLVREACEQYQVLRNKVSGNMGWRMAHRDCLYNRQILATGLMNTAPDKAEARALRQKWAGHWKSAKLTHYDAEYTPYDLFSSRGFVAPDYSKGAITLRYLGPLSDEDFSEIVNTLLSKKEKEQKSK